MRYLSVSIFWKAFDTIEFETLFAVLQAFGFGDKYMDMVHVLYTDQVTYIANSGFWGKCIFHTRGTRQGCCYSPSIFSLTIEMLGLSIRQNENIKGMKIASTEIKSGQYADDLWSSLIAEQSNLEVTLDELEKFETFSGLKINAGKTAILILSPWRDTEAKFPHSRDILVSCTHLHIRCTDLP